MVCKLAYNNKANDYDSLGISCATSEGVENGGELQLFNLAKNNITKIILIIICVTVLAGCSAKSGLPRKVDKTLERNGVENYTIKDDSDNDFIKVLMKDNYTSFDIVDENEEVYFITYDDKQNNIILLGPDNKIIEGMIDDFIIPLEDVDNYTNHGNKN